MCIRDRVCSLRPARTCSRSSIRPLITSWWPAQRPVSYTHLDVYKRQSYIHICQNNTIFGTQYVEVPQVEGVPLVADMSSMILSKPVDVNKYGCIYFGVQKNVAPAGMAIADVYKRQPKDTVGRKSTAFRRCSSWRTNSCAHWASRSAFSISTQNSSPPVR